MWRTAFALASPGGRRGRLSVLIFHRVLARPDPLFPDEMHAERFDALCGWVRRWFNVLPLDEAVRLRAAGRLPPRALSISFDDGYADNHDVAMPILLRHGLSATFFISTGYLDGGRMWNDSVIEALRSTALERLDLQPLGMGLGGYGLDSLAARREAIHAILSVVKYLEPAHRLDVVAQIARLAGVVLPDDLMMSSSQVRAMRAAGLVIGAHTVNHPILLKLGAEDVTREVRHSRETLQQLLGEPVGLFAYPNGKPGIDYDQTAADIVRAEGFDAAFSTAWGAASSSSDSFQLPRFTPWDTSRPRFGLRMLRNLMGVA
jgi:peptidoglycan/xylan/chitin deacetylase (PgdA/CDA1 family)